MAATDAYKKWAKENTVVYSLRFQKSTDADIIEYLADKPKQTTIKTALREYIKNHSSAVQPTAEEEVENISAEEELEALYGDLPWDEED